MSARSIEQLSLIKAPFLDHAAQLRDILSYTSQHDPWRDIVLRHRELVADRSAHSRLNHRHVFVSLLTEGVFDQGPLRPQKACALVLPRKFQKLSIDCFFGGIIDETPLVVVRLLQHVAALHRLVALTFGIVAQRVQLRLL